MQETIEENRKRLAKELERIRLNKIALRSKDNRTEKSIQKAKVRKEKKC